MAQPQHKSALARINLGTVAPATPGPAELAAEAATHPGSEMLVHPAEEGDASCALQPVGIALRRLRVALTLHREQQDTCGPKRNSKRGPSKHGPERNSRRGPTTHAPQGPQAQHVLPMGVANIESVREWGPLGATQVPLVLWVGG